MYSEISDDEEKEQEVKRGNKFSMRMNSIRRYSSLLLILRLPFSTFLRALIWLLILRILKKGLEVTDLMHLKKNTAFPDNTLNPFSKYDQNTKDTLIFRDANGLSFDFPNNGTTVYYVSREECTIRKCGISYKDTYIESYLGHQSPDYKFRCNPFDPSIFITCSYDWTIKISTTTKQNKPLITCKSMNRVRLKLNN